MLWQCCKQGTAAGLTSLSFRRAIISVSDIADRWLCRLLQLIKGHLRVLQGLVHIMTVATLLCRYFALLRQAFTAWLGFQLRQQSKRHQLRQLAAVHAFWMSKQTWAVWRQQFLPTAREKSRAYARANKHWQSNALCSAMHAWAEVDIVSMCFDANKRLLFSAFK